MGLKYDTPPKAGKSPWGPDDQKGQLNRIDSKSREAIMARIDGRQIYDLSVDYFIGMPSFQAAGDPAYQMWMTHTPRGTIVDNLVGFSGGTFKLAYTTIMGTALLIFTITGFWLWYGPKRFKAGRNISNRRIRLEGDS